jgi:hypothetical protein
MTADVPDYDLDWRYRAAVPRMELRQAIQAGRIPFSSYSDEAYRFHATTDGELSLVAEGDTDRVEQAIDVDDVIQAPDTETRALFAGGNLRPVVDTIPDGATVAFQLGEEIPLRLRWTLQEEIHGEPTTVAEATYVIAPRIERGGR